MLLTFDMSMKYNNTCSDSFSFFCNYFHEENSLKATYNFNVDKIMYMYFIIKLNISERLRQEKLAKARAARSSAPPVTKVDIAPRPPSEAKSIDEGLHIPEVSLAYT